MRSLKINERPYTERFDGVERVKVPPVFGPHGLAATSIVRLLQRCAEDRGFVSVEPHMRLGAIDGTDTVFVPDIAYVDRERFHDFPDAYAMPEFAPDIGVEIRSPGVDPRDLERKIAKYLACGTQLVLDVDPDARSIVAQRADGVVRRFERGDEFEDAAFPWLRFDVAEAFSELDRFERTVRSSAGEPPC